MAGRPGRSSFAATRSRGAAAGLFVVVAIVSFAAVAVALVSQYAYAMDPCPWCVLERLILVVIGVLGLLGLAARRTAAARGIAGIALLLACAGFAATMWQHFVAAKSASCNLTLADRIMSASQLDRLLPSVFEARASCADAAVTLAGIPYDFLAAAVFLACAVAAVRILRGAA